MARPPSEPATTSLIGPDPGRLVRVWVALLLRLGIGLSLVSSGLSGYFGMTRGTSMGMLDPFLSGLPYLAIGLGLALILGFLTTAAAIGAGIYSLIPPIFAISQTLITGTSRGFNPGSYYGTDQFFALMLSASVPGLLTNAGLIWLSPMENNPFSVDALIFGRDDIEPIRSPFPVPEPATATVEEPPLHIGE